MARYQRGDILLIDRGDGGDDTEVIVLTVVFDGTLNDIDSIYHAENVETGDTYNVSDSQVTDIIDGPTLTGSEELDDLPNVTEPVVRDPLTVEDQMHMSYEERVAELESLRDTIPAQNTTQVQPMIPPAPRPRINMSATRPEINAIPAAMMDTMWGRPQRQEVREETTEPIPVPTPLFNEGRELVNAAEVSIQREDYNPRIGRDRRLCFFQFAGLTITPYLEGDLYVFRDVNGEEWVNQHQHSEVYGMLSRVNDSHNQRWSTRTVFENELRMGGRVNPYATPKVGKSRKKLRRKHPIPEIKDEKYYASKEFIA